MTEAGVAGAPSRGEKVGRRAVVAQVAEAMVRAGTEMQGASGEKTGVN